MKNRSVLSVIFIGLALIFATTQNTLANPIQLSPVEKVIDRYPWILLGLVIASLVVIVIAIAKFIRKLIDNNR